MGDMSLTVLEEFLDERKETFRNFPPCVDCVGGPCSQGTNPDSLARHFFLPQRICVGRNVLAQLRTLHDAFSTPTKSIHPPLSLRILDDFDNPSIEQLTMAVAKSGTAIQSYRSTLRPVKQKQIC